MAKSKKQEELEQRITELTADLQRTRADFENYRKRMDTEKTQARESGKASAILQLLPVIDNIERAITHMPVELKGNAWADSVAGLIKNLEKSLQSLDLARINAKPGTVFDPELHEAIQFDEDSEGEHEVVSEELQTGYLLGGQPIRHAMVKVVRK
ncbi:MAG TPA: nucleotide exchange factor GrpE [Candidatus Saccharimonadaceae bacterium]|nr:nucleotide exchange factor GrpE [Candidatus Saccharimonadaceae bacterium]